MPNIEQLNAKERKEAVKAIEKHLKNYRSYMAAISNIERRIDFDKTFLSGGRKSVKENTAAQSSNLKQYQLIVSAIDCAMGELEETEVIFIEYRYFNQWSIKKCALQIGYSDKTLFILRNRVMDKLLISLSDAIVFA